MVLASRGYKVVIRYLDGRVEKSVSKRTVSVTHKTFQIITSTGKVRTVPLSELKAVFFVRDLEGDPKYNEKKEITRESPKLGYVVKVTFKDGEVVLGKSLNPSFGENGFYMEPADPNSNNERIFVIRQNVEKIEVTPG